VAALRRHLSYANVVATLALVIALGAGTVYAASKISGKSVKKNTLPGNRVKKGTLPGNRLQSNTVKGSKVDESTLGMVPSAQIAGSANTAYEVFQSPDPAGLPFQNKINLLVRIQLPVGKYAVNGKVVLTNNTGSDITHSVSCSLLAGAGYFDQSVVSFIPDGGSASFAMQTVTYLPASGPVTVECNPGAVPSNGVTATQGKINAVSVADVNFGPSLPIPPNDTG
jgi:hypothetical protein